MHVVVRMSQREVDEALTLRTSTWLLLAGVAVLPLQQWPIGRLFGYGVLAADALFALAILVRGFAWLDGRAPLRFCAFHGWLLTYVVAMGVSCCVSPQFFASAGKWTGVLYLALLGVLVCDLAEDSRLMRNLVLVWIAAALVTSLLSLVAVFGFCLGTDSVALQSLIAGYGSLPPGPYPRVQSTFLNMNMLCNYLSVTLCLLLAARALGWVGKGIFRTAMACLLLAALATISPGLGGIALILGVWGGWRLREHFPRLARVALGSGMLVAVLMLAGMWLNPAAPFTEPSIRWRIWQAAWKTWLQHPWFGVGVGKDVVGVSFLAPSGELQWLTDAHNVWLNVAGQAGLVGVLGLFGLTLWVLWSAPRDRVRTGTQPSILQAAWQLAFVAAFVYQGLAGSFEDARHIWIVIGVLAAMGARPRSTAPQTSAEMKAEDCPATLGHASSAGALNSFS